MSDEIKMKIPMLYDDTDSIVIDEIADKLCMNAGCTDLDCSTCAFNFGPNLIKFIKQSQED